MVSEKLLTAQEVADMLACSSKHVKDLALENDLRYTKIGREYRFRKSDVDAYLDGKEPGEISNSPQGKLEAINTEIALAEKKIELAKLNGQLITKEALEAAYAKINAAEDEANGRIKAAELATKELIQDKQAALEEITAREKESQAKWGSVEKAEKDLEDRENKFQARLVQETAKANAKETEVAQRELVANDLIRIIGLVIPQYCGSDVWYEVATRINKLAQDRQKRKAFNEPIPAGQFGI